MKNKLKYQDVAVVGERIRSYDFHDRKNCYIEGIIQRIDEESGYKAFVVLVDTDVWPRLHSAHLTNHPTRIGQTVCVPMGIAVMDWEDRILNMSPQPGTLAYTAFIMAQLDPQDDDHDFWDRCCSSCGRMK